MSTWHHGSETPYDKPERLVPAHYQPLPPTFPCDQCGRILASKDELRKHRFERHPQKRPSFFLQERELGDAPIRVTRRVTKDAVRHNGCDRAFINGAEIPVSSIHDELRRKSSGVYRLVLTKTGVSAEFTLDFRIASAEDLAGVEQRFADTVRIRRGYQLDSEAIDTFISNTESFRTASGYVDGICEYLYGLRTKDGGSDISRPNDTYVNRFNRSIEALTAYDRPLARAIAGAVAFHFNHFEQVVHLTGNSALAQAATIYTTWLLGKTPTPPTPNADASTELQSLELATLDRITARLVCWVIRPLSQLTKNARRQIASLLANDPETYDAVKMHILLGELDVARGSTKDAQQHARALRNVSGLEKWTDSMFSRCHSGSER